MKKVICVDAKSWHNTTVNKEYMVHKEDEKHYYIIDDSGNEFGYYKNHFKDTEPTFTYGQQVECDITKSKVEKVRVLATNDTYAWVDRNDGSPFTVYLTSIRPIRSVRDRIVDVLKPKLAFNNIEEMDSIIDRILEITNPADK